MDRNVCTVTLPSWSVLSLSARRAWIEIIRNRLDYKALSVALRKESVDRNVTGGASGASLQSRSPQGERG